MLFFFFKKVSNLNGNTNCKYYDNRKVMDHRRLPPAFDLEDLMSVGEELKACPFYAARAMAQTAHIIFCPYNYLIEPSIRSSVSVGYRPVYDTRGAYLAEFNNNGLVYTAE